MAKGKIVVDKEACKSCMYCIQVCPKKLLTLSEDMNSSGYPYIVSTDESACTGCALCARMCPDAAITVYRG